MLKQKLLAMKKLLLRKPRLLILVSFVVFMLLFAGFECLRARTYLRRVDDYRQSVAVLELKDAIQKMSVVAEDEYPDPVLCEFVAGGRLSQQGASLTEMREGEMLDSAVNMVHDRAENALPSPRFASMLIILPQVSKARTESAKLKDGTDRILYLTSEDKESQYCLSLLDVLREVYFVSDLRTPQGVGALRVGQIENFQINVDQAQEKLREINPPTRFTSQHILINDFLNDLRTDVRINTNDRDTFARAIDEDYETLNAILTDIGYYAENLRKLPEHVLINSSVLH